MDELPNELIIYILLNFRRLKCVLPLKNVCQKFKNIIFDDYFIKKILNYDRKINIYDIYSFIYLTYKNMAYIFNIVLEYAKETKTETLSMWEKDGDIYIYCEPSLQMKVNKNQFDHIKLEHKILIPIHILQDCYKYKDDIIITIQKNNNKWEYETEYLGKKYMHYSTYKTSV